MCWRESIVHPILYAIVPPFTGLTDLMNQDVEQRSERLWQTAMRRGVDTVAGLTAVDGATVISDQYELLAFGVKIKRAAKSWIERSSVKPKTKSEPGAVATG